MHGGETIPRSWVKDGKGKGTENGLVSGSEPTRNVESCQVQQPCPKELRHIQKQLLFTHLYTSIRICDPPESDITRILFLLVLSSARSLVSGGKSWIEADYGKPLIKDKKDLQLPGLLTKEQMQK